MFNNAVTAQYTHTLTVTGRVGGQYQCIVSNSKPSTATAQLTVEGTYRISHGVETEIINAIYSLLSTMQYSTESELFLTRIVIIY